MLFIFCKVIQTHCGPENVLGSWKIQFSDLDGSDIIECPENPSARHVINVELRYPNIAVTDDGFMGTWIMSGTQAIQISVKKLDFYFFFVTTEDGPNRTISHCNASSHGWVSEQGVARPEGCLRARNLKPLDDSATTIENHGIDPSVKEATGPIEKHDHIPYQGDILPKTFDWRNISNESFVQLPLNELSCDSSYVFASLYMMSSRVRIQSNNTIAPLFSLQEQLDCNTYANECDGGLPDEVGLYAEKIGIVEEETYKVDYKGIPGQCKRFSSDKRFYFYQTAPLGGQTRPYSALEMEWEIYRYGPIVAGISMEPNFPEPFGEFTGRIDHYLLLVGWTVLANGTPVWIAQNSWGHHWNGDGAAYIAMGYNSYGIETATYVTNWRSEGAPQWTGKFIPIETFTAGYKNPTELIMTILLVTVSVIAVVLAVLLIIKIAKGRFAKAPKADEVPRESE